jgi:hypothetical protein
MMAKFAFVLGVLVTTLMLSWTIGAVELDEKQLREILGLTDYRGSPSAGAGAGVRGLGTSTDVRAECSEPHWLDENRRLSSGAYYSLRRTAFHLECPLLNR